MPLVDFGPGDVQLGAKSLHIGMTPTLVFLEGPIKNLELILVEPMFLLSHLAVLANWNADPSRLL